MSAQKAKSPLLVICNDMCYWHVAVFELEGNVCSAIENPHISYHKVTYSGAFLASKRTKYKASVKAQGENATPGKGGTRRPLMGQGCSRRAPQRPEVGQRVEVTEVTFMVGSR